MLSKLIKWLAAVGAGAAVVGLRALAVAVGVPVADLDPLVQAALAAAIIKLVNWLIGKLPASA